MKYYYLLLLTSIILFNACKDSYTGNDPLPPTCLEYTPNDTVEFIRGTVYLEDTTAYISNYVDETTTTKYYPCNLSIAYQKDGFPLTYSGFLRKREGDNKQYIELTYTEPILNETIITNYMGFLRNRDSSSIPVNERVGIIKQSKFENNKLKLLITYRGCTKGRNVYFSLYKTVKELGVTKISGFLTSPYESCNTEYTVWYEIDLKSYQENTLIIQDEVKKHEFVIP